MAQKRIMLIEDDKNILAVNKEILELEQFHVETATSLKEGIEKIARFLPDVIVLDIMLPDGSGIQMCKKLREKTNVPILFLTCKDDKRDIIEGLNAGGDDYMVIRGRG